MGLLSAALRHARDAEHLVAADPPVQSLDQAYHLAGFGPECARKATLSTATFDKAIGHGFEGASEFALDFACATDPRTTRYHVNNDEASFPELRRWSPQARYERTGTYQDPYPLLEEVRTIVDGIVFALWADGEIPEDFPW
jgi:hypothetical protein